MPYIRHERLFYVWSEKSRVTVHRLKSIRNLCSSKPFVRDLLQIAAQLTETYITFRDEIPLDPQWGIKKNSEGKNLFWYGFKGHSTLKQYAVEHECSIALPYNIGCGLANGDWTIVSRMIEEVFHDYDVTLYKL